MGGPVRPSLDDLAATFRRTLTRTRLLALPSERRSSHLTFANTAAEVRDALISGEAIPFSDRRLWVLEELLSQPPKHLSLDAVSERLRQLDGWAEEVIDDTGVSPLMIGFGLVSRTDPVFGGVLAPLMLCPVAVADLGGRPTLRAVGPLEWNRLLIEDLGLDPARFHSDPLVWSEAEARAQGGPVVLPLAQLGLFEFDRDALWRRISGRDDPGLADHPRVRRMIEGSDEPWPATTQWPVTPPVSDPDLDRVQGETIQATRCGWSLVLQGGPGTGKTRVVEHVIFNAMRDRRRVLVLCGRGSAFRAILGRLTARGFEDHCVELYGHHLDPTFLADRLTVPRRESVRATLEQLDRPPAVVFVTPASFAMHVPPAWTFDLLVIDEGSLVTMVEALPALAVSEQFVAAGDSLQMQKDPAPSVLFNRETPYVAPATIMDAAVAAKVATAELLHHYRSRNTMLIHVTNRISYDGVMQITAPPELEEEPGFRVRRVKGFFDVKTLTNPVEADAVVEAVAAHIAGPDAASLGVITTTREQRNLIRRRLVERGIGPKTVVGGRPLIVADYNTVQGEERDVILISMAYGPQKKAREKRPGVSHWPTFYGAISMPEGEKRLNVMMTRARDRVVMFTSFPRDSIHPGRNYAHGRLFSYVYAGEIAFEIRKDPHEGVFAQIGKIAAWQAFEFGNAVGLFDVRTKRATAAIYVTGHRHPSDEAAEIGQYRALGWSVHVMTAEAVAALEDAASARDALAAQLLTRFAA